MQGSGTALRSHHLASHRYIPFSNLYGGPTVVLPTSTGFSWCVCVGGGSSSLSCCNRRQGCLRPGLFHDVLMAVSKAHDSAGLLVRWGDGCGPQPPYEPTPGLEHAAQLLLGACQARVVDLAPCA